MSRFVFGRGWVFCDETNGEGDGNGGAGGATAPVIDGEAAADTPEGGDDVLEGEPLKEEKGAAVPPKDMKAAIDAGLGYKKGPNGEALEPLTGKVKEADTKPAEKKPAAEEKHANGAPKKNEKGEDLDDKGQVMPKQAPKLKTSTELALSKEQAAALKPEARERFQQVITTLKAHEGTIAKQTETIKGLSEARDAILGVMQETQTTQDEFAGYLQFNSLVKSKDPRHLTEALEIVEEQRLALYKALGKEPAGGGIDLLADFPDLKEKVIAAQLTREDALEIAQGRRDKAARDQAAQQQQQRQRQQSQTEVQRKQAETTALDGITKWTAELSTTDLDYKAKEDKLLAKVSGVIEKYPPNLWLSTLKMMYEGIEVQKAPSGSSRQVTPLRPSGAKPGAKAPASMLDAINQGLGYAGAEKG